MSCVGILGNDPTLGSQIVNRVGVTSVNEVMRGGPILSCPATANGYHCNQMAATRGSLGLRVQGTQWASLCLPRNYFDERASVLGFVILQR